MNICLDFNFSTPSNITAFAKSNIHTSHKKGHETTLSHLYCLFHGDSVHFPYCCYMLYSNKGAVSISNPNHAPIVFFGPIVQGWVTPDLSWGLAAMRCPTDGSWQMSRWTRWTHWWWLLGETSEALLLKTWNFFFPIPKQANDASFRSQLEPLLGTS